MSPPYSGRNGIVSARRPATPPPGRLETALLRLLARRATVTESVPLGERFRQITLAGPALRGQPWSPGQKIQLQFGRWTQRSYTPTCWDSERGVVQIIAYLPALGPGSQWAATVQPGDECALSGPRRSLDPLRTKAPVVLFGDETALGLLQALTLATGPLDPLHAVLEAHSAPALHHAADALGLRSVTIIQRTPDDSHRSAVEQALLAPLRRFPSRHCVLAGRAQSIQHAARLLRHQRVPSSQISTRAYWSVGKEGLE